MAVVRTILSPLRERGKADEIITTIQDRNGYFNVGIPLSPLLNNLNPIKINSKTVNYCVLKKQI